MRFAWSKTLTLSRKCAAVCVVVGVCTLFIYEFLWTKTVQDYCWKHDRVLILSEPKPVDSGYNIALGCAITSSGMEPDDIVYTTSFIRDNSLANLVFFQQLLPSFCKTASVGFKYRFYLAYDFNDKWFNNTRVRTAFNNIFYSKIKSMCIRENGSIAVDFKFVRCDHNQAPAWAQNDAMMAAFFESDMHMQYFYRVNDDTVLLTANWTEYFIQVLLQMYPPNVGVVGPTALNRALLAYDFVHRTHIDIFHYYYPRDFRNWFADRWITHVYQPRTVRLSHVMVDHTRELRTRYKVTRKSKRFLNALIINGRIAVSSWINSRELSENTTLHSPYLLLKNATR